MDLPNAVKKVRGAIGKVQESGRKMTNPFLRVAFVVLASVGLAGCKSSKPPTAPPSVAVAAKPVSGDGAVTPTTERIWLTWDLSQSNAVAALGTPDSKQAMFPEDMDDGTQMWFWKGSGRVVIKLPRGRTIDSHANSLSARVKNDHVVGVNFNTGGSTMDATELRRAMVRIINNLHLRNGGDADGTVGTLDRWIAKSQTSPYVPAENFGSRDGEPNVDVRVSKAVVGTVYDLAYELFWFE